MAVHGGVFEASYPKGTRPKNPGVTSAVSDPPPDLRLKPPMRGEVDKNDRGRNKQYDSSVDGNVYTPAWKKPNTISRRGQDRIDSELVDRPSSQLSRGDLRRGRNPNY